MAPQSDLQTAPQRRSVDRGNHRFRARLDGVDHLGEGGTDRRLAEFGDIGARKECAPLAGDDNGLDGIVRGRLSRDDEYVPVLARADDRHPHLLFPGPLRDH